MFKRAAFASTLLLCVFASGADEPGWLKEARAREGSSLMPTELRSEDGWLKVSTPGKLVNPIEKLEGSYTVELDVGGDSSVYCEVYPEGIDLANSLRSTLLAAIKEIESSQGKLDARVLESSDAGAYGTVPYIAMSWLYRVASADGARVGALKQLVLEKGDASVYCAHNELGFTRTFTTIARAFADSLETGEPVAAPHYLDISTASIAGAKIGVAVSTLERDGEGDTRARQMTALLIATDDGSIQAQDSIHVDWVRPDGTLINAANSDVSNGELSSDLSLKEDEGVWLVEGEVQGKAVKTTLPKDSQPGNWVAQARQMRALLAEPDAPGREHTMGFWIAENPEKLTVAKTRILAKQGDRHFTARGEVGGITADLKLDSTDGMASAADLKLGPLDLKLERVHVSGSF